MIALVQRVHSASVSVDEDTVGAINQGMLILLGVRKNDTSKEMEWVARKCANLRIFSDDDGKMNRSILESGGRILVVSQFTLYGNTNKGNRPSFVDSAIPEKAKPLYQQFVERLDTLTGKKVETGVFGATMKVTLVNDGPVSLWIRKEVAHNK